MSKHNLPEHEMAEMAKPGFALPEHAPLQHAQATLGVGSGLIWAWLAKYGFAIVLKVLGGLTGVSAGSLTLAQIIAWIQTALGAVQAGQPLPTLPMAEHTAK